MQPCLSVILPCYNVERWVSRCLDQVLTALPADGEVLAVDDASVDATRAILRTRAHEDPRLQVIAARHGGLSAARNRGLEAARGRYVFFVDADDGVAPDFFTAMVEALERDAADCCVCAFAFRAEGAADAPCLLKGDYRFRTNGEIVAGFLSRIFGYSFASVRAWYRGQPLFGERELASVWRVAYRRDLIEAAHLRFREDVSYFEDVVFNGEYMLAASSMTCVNRPLYFYATSRRSSLTKIVPRDGRRLCANKLVLLRKRDELNCRAGGALTPFYEGTNVFAALEILSYVVRLRLPLREGLRIFFAYLSTPSVRAALAGFPLSVRRPVLAVAVILLRTLVCCGRHKEML